MTDQDCWTAIIQNVPVSSILVLAPSSEEAKRKIRYILGEPKYSQMLASWEQDGSQVSNITQKLADIILKAIEKR